MAAEKWAAARAAAAGTSAAAAVDAAADAVNASRDAALSAAQAAATAAQAGRDITEAAEQLLLAQRRGTRQSVIDAAGAALEQAVPDANTAVARATDAQAAAARAAADAAILVDAAVAAAGNTSAAATVLVAATASRAAASLVQATGEILARGVTIGLELVGLTAGQLIGEVVTDIFDTVLADVDLVIPSGPSRQSRGLVTHEYGHFVLCDMIYRTSPFKFGSAWTKTIADTVAKQALELDRTNDENAFINEAFAEFFAGQVAGGVNYFTPEGSESAFFLGPSPEWHDPMNWCDANGMDRLRCIEDNFGAGMGPKIPGSMEDKQVSGSSMTGNPIEDPFRDQVARITTILHDAFDGHPNNPAQNLPGNGGAWTFNTGLMAPRRFEEFVTPIDSLDQPGMLQEESITLAGSGLFRTIQEWLDQEPPLAQLRERTFLGGLTRAMRVAGFSRDEICRLYILHQPNDICPPPPVGPPPIIIE